MSALPSTYNDVVVDPVTRMDHGLFKFSAYPDRPPLAWPNGAKVAIAVVITVAAGDVASNPTNLIGFTHRDYGPRVGLFRLMGILDELGIRATVPLSDALLTRSPRVAEEVLKLGWEIAGHGEKANLGLNSTMSEADELAYIEASRAALLAATGIAPRGWLGPGNSESSHTLHLLAGAGYDYTLDWGNDDQPYDFIVPKGRLSALPYSVETSDAAVVQAQSHTPWEYEQALADHLEGLLADSNGSVMTLGLQANVSGQPFRAKYIRKFLETAAATPGVWFATGSAIIDAYRAG
ncbi:polysaccharide deacetylase family protein [Devosia beringensis]|uniref:polysaccharide deacetylase family protein n=1 Tax=Devosia beringensis TaxID=2657486 RepID=UPI00186BA7BE|nr:polysaccharide deacetylase family protein [Devosia beringensis]